MRTEARAERGTLAYGVVTLLGAGVAVVLLGGTPGTTWGIFTAWLIQLVAFWRLDLALSEPRDATRAWLGGIAARLGGLGIAAALAVTGRATEELPIAYAVAMLALLLAEAGWLAVRLPRSGSAVGRGSEDDMDRTHPAG